MCYIKYFQLHYTRSKFPSKLCINIYIYLLFSRLYLRVDRANRKEQLKLLCVDGNSTYWRD